MPQLVDLGYTAGKAAPGHRLPGSLLGFDAGATYTNDNATTPETSILAAGVATANLFPAALAVGDAYEIRLRGLMLNTSGTNKTQRIRVYHGAYALFDATTPNLTSSATARQWWVDLLAVVTTLGAGSVATMKILGSSVGFNTLMGTGTGYQPLGGNMLATNEAASTGTDANLVVNVARDFNVTSLHSAAGTSLSTTLNIAMVRHYPKNV